MEVVHFKRHRHASTYTLKQGSKHQIMVALNDDLGISSGPTVHQLRAARNAAKRPHALINLVRMVKLLEVSANQVSYDEEDEEASRKEQLQLLQRHLDVSSFGIL